MKKLYLLNLFMLCLAGSGFAQSQTDYSTNAQLTGRVDALAKKFPQYLKSKVLTKTVTGKDIWMLTLGTGETQNKPAIAVVGGVDGKHLLGVEMAIGFAEKLMGMPADSLKKLLAVQTYYVFPNMSPDATEQYFGKVKYERSGNGTPTDDDRDGLINEDGYDDLDGNGKITWMRVLDPTGTYRMNPDDNRSLVLADAAKGETGKYKLIREGIDNDKDGKFNEDAEGGISFNRNSSFNFKNFVPGAGEFAVSEKENRALFDFLFDASNIYALVSFGPSNNLSTPVVFNPMGISKRIITGWYDQDAKANALVSERYNKITGTKDAPKVTPESGDFSQWGYFHFGRLSFSTPGWWVPKARPDTTKKEKALSTEDAVPAYLRWAAAQGITNTFTEWKAVNHPDFPGQTVEVGGLDPYVLINPPYKLVDPIVSKHTSFILALSAMAPSVDLVNVKTEKVGEGLTRITAKVMNTGILPTLTKVGEKSYFLKKIGVRLTLASGQSVISGRQYQTLDAIPGRDFTELTWLIKGSGKVALYAGSPSSGNKTVDLTL